MRWATFWAIFSPTHQVTLLGMLINWRIIANLVQVVNFDLKILFVALLCI
jgi:hypothetical protein